MGSGKSPARSPSTLRTAISLLGSRPTSRACRCSPPGRATLKMSPSSMTWKFVTMWPWSSQTKPDPLPRGTASSLEKKKSADELDIGHEDDGVLGPLDDLDGVALVLEEPGLLPARGDGSRAGRRARPGNRDFVSW